MDEQSKIRDAFADAMKPWPEHSERDLTKMFWAFQQGWRRRAAQPVAGWQDISSAPKDGTRAIYWVTRKTAEEAYRDTSGNPIMGEGRAHMVVCQYGGWSALSKALYWCPLPTPPLADTIDMPAALQADAAAILAQSETKEGKP